MCIIRFYYERYTFKNRKRTAYILLLPAVFLVFSIILFPIFANVWISFKEVGLKDIRIPEPRAKKIVKSIKDSSDEIKIIFKYPLLSTFTKYTKSSDTAKMIFDLTADCIEEVHFNDEVTNKVDMSKKELDEFLESLSTEQFGMLVKFFETMPRLRHRIEVTNPKTEVTSEVMLEGIQSFLV